MLEDLLLQADVHVGEAGMARGRLRERGGRGEEIEMERERIGKRGMMKWI